MPSNGLIVILSIRPEKVERLCNELARLRVASNAPLEAPSDSEPFTWSKRLHFARLALFPPTPGNTAPIPRLLLATDYDGDWLEHVTQLHSFGCLQENIWECCEGYLGLASFAEWIDRHTVEPGAYYIAFRDRGVDELYDAVSLRQSCDKLLSQPDAMERFRYLREQLCLVLALKGVVDLTLTRLTRLLQFLGSVPAVFRIIQRFGFPLFLLSAKQINQTLDRVGWIRVLNILTRNTREYAGPRAFELGPPFSEALNNNLVETASHQASFEDTLLQNQLTLVTEVPPEDVPRLKVVLSLIDLYGRSLSTPGTLVDISTIHTVRWALIDGDRRLLMVSNYDGSWENYIDEFAEMILSGLNALWCSAPDYPRAGAQDVAALKQFLRRHQVHSSFFYSAYPQRSVLNLKNDLEFVRWLGWILRKYLPPSRTQTQPCNPASAHEPTST